MAHYPKVENRKEDVIEAIRKARGNISVAAKMLGIHRVTLHRHIKEDKELAEILEEERETMIDNVESKLYSEAMNGNTTAMIFFLKTQGKKRGYVDRQEFSGDIVIKWDWERPKQTLTIEKPSDEDGSKLLTDGTESTYGF